MMPMSALLRSPRERLGGYLLLPRLIDKIRLHAKGALPPEYVGNLLRPAGLTLDGRFLSFTGLDAEQFREAVLSEENDDAVLAWVERHAIPHTASEKEAWARAIAAARPTPETAEYRKKIYPELVAKVDLASINVLDMIDLDEGRIPTG
ncbi:MAG: DUF5069 domain-containing protein [Candidatus Manganitrophaceae bacterium]|nr:MAG: DUF5069 domain-containing protein [Candidatus Manganitrophaceae bacterium]